MPNMMEWNDAFKTGDEKIDKQHEVFINLFNHVFESLDTFNHTDPAAVMTPFEKLRTHVEEHLRYEEELMKRLNYPAMERHTRDHDKLKSLALRPDLTPTHSTVKERLMLILNWYKAHTQSFDRELAKFTKTHGEET